MKESTMTKRVIIAEVDQEWFDILSQLTRHQDGFVWIKVKEKGEKESE
jgi:hypothetical protein